MSETFGGYRLDDLGDAIRYRCYTASLVDDIEALVADRDRLAAENAELRREAGMAKYLESLWRRNLTPVLPCWVDADGRICRPHGEWTMFPVYADEECVEIAFYKLGDERGHAVDLVPIEGADDE